MLIMFDFDGTVIKETVFHVVRDYLIDKIVKKKSNSWKFLKELKEGKAYGIFKILMERTNSERYAMRVLRDLDIIIYRNSGYNIKKHDHIIAKKLTMVDNVDKFIKSLNERGHRIFILSQAQYDIVVKFLKVHNLLDYVDGVYATYLITDNKGNVLDFFCWPVDSKRTIDMFNLNMSKHRVVENLQKKYSKIDGIEYDRRNTVFITDYENELELTRIRKLARVYLLKTNHPRFEEIKDKVDLIFESFYELYNKI